MRAVTGMLVLLLVAAPTLVVARGSDDNNSDGLPAAVAEETHEDDAETFSYLKAAPKDVLLLVRMTDFAFAADVLEVNAGEVVKIAIQNVQAEGMAMEMEEPDIHCVLTEPAGGVVQINVHEPGEYVFYCTVAGHPEVCVEGVLIVR